MEKKTITSTELFVGKSIPDFIKNHAFFKNPVPVKKIFPSVGLSNFKEKISMDKCFVDIKKPGSYVWNLLQAMTVIVNNTKIAASLTADNLYWGCHNADERAKHRERYHTLYSLSRILQSITSCVDVNIPSVMDAIVITKGKVSLKLIKDIVEDNKVVFEKGSSLFSVFNTIKSKCDANGVVMEALEQNEVFKTFSKENVPNKEYYIVFSSDGEEGAWDIATMSMRGITSCQRWEGEYQRCLIGSILSKFVGIIYLTSGVMNEGDEKNGKRPNLGTKMMRRCLVRYIVDADEGKPCILIDKLYPTEASAADKDIIKLFIDTMKTKTNLPVHYAQTLGNKSKHMYIPHEKLREEMSDRDWSYQDTPLKSKADLNTYILSSNKEEIEREIKALSMNLSLFIARKMEAVFLGNISVDLEIKKTISNIRMNIAFASFCEALVANMMYGFRAPPSHTFSSSKDYYRKYLIEMLINKKRMKIAAKASITDLIKQNSSRTVDVNMFIDYAFSLTSEFAKSEASKLID